MKKIICGAMLAFGMYGNCEGMMDNYRSEDLLERLDSLLQEEKALQESKMLLVEGIRKKLLSEKSEFDRDAFEKELNPKISKRMMKLLDSSLNGKEGCLEYCSERLSDGLLNNERIFKSYINRAQRNDYIYNITLYILKSSIDDLETSIRALKNILFYCGEKIDSASRVLIDSVF